MDSLLLHHRLEVLLAARKAAADSSEESIEAARTRLETASGLMTRMQILVERTDKILQKYGISTPAAKNAD